MKLELTDGVFVLQESIQGKAISQALKAKTKEEAEKEAAGILERWRDRLRNLYLRNGVWYCRGVVDGRRISKSLDLPESDWEIAGRRARGLLEKVSKGKWEILDDTSSKPGWATFGDVERVFRAAALKHDLRDRTVSDYVACMRTILDLEESAFAAAPVTAASKGAILAYVDRRLDESDNDSVRRSIKSTIRQARALFGSKWALEAYKEAKLRLHDVSEFCTCFTVEAETKRYVMTEDRKRLIQLTREEANALHSNGSPLWPVYLLVYWLALRSSEAQAARWSWIVQDGDGRWWIQIVDRPEEDFWTKGNQGKVPIPSQVHAWLEEIRAGRIDDTAYILPGKNKTERRLLINDQFSTWMRSIGWSKKTYQHCAHELRAARGSEWFTKRGLEAARAWLRHADPATTVRYYADFTCQPPTLEVGE